MVFSMVFMTSFQSSFSTRFRTVFSHILANSDKLRKQQKKNTSKKIELTVNLKSSLSVYSHIGAALIHVQTIYKPFLMPFKNTLCVNWVYWARGNMKPCYLWPCISLSVEPTYQQTLFLELHLYFWLYPEQRGNQINTSRRAVWQKKLTCCPGSP